MSVPGGNKEKGWEDPTGIWDLLPWLSIPNPDYPWPGELLPLGLIPDPGGGPRGKKGTGGMDEGYTEGLRTLRKSGNERLLLNLHVSFSVGRFGINPSRNGAHPSHSLCPSSTRYFGVLWGPSGKPGMSGTSLTSRCPMAAFPREIRDQIPAGIGVTPLSLLLWGREVLGGTQNPLENQECRGKSSTGTLIARCSVSTFPRRNQGTNSGRNEGGSPSLPPSGAAG